MPSGRVIVIGGGAGGMMAAGRAAECGASVLLLEKTAGVGKKILVTGNTRCNLTNAREIDDFVAMFGANGRFLYQAFGTFFRDELVAFLRRYGVETRTEESTGRVFPVSDDARDVVEALQRYLAECRVTVHTRARVIDIIMEGGAVAGVRTESGQFDADAVILATGGSSYPATGSSGDGYRLAAAVGHTIVALRPALVPLVLAERERARSMQGVSLQNVRLTALQCTAGDVRLSMVPAADSGRGIAGKSARQPVIESRRGSLLFTHLGISGPATLQMSLAVVEALERGPVSISIDVMPDLSSDDLKRRLQLDFERFGKRTCRSILAELVPRKMAAPLIEMSGMSPEKRGHQITAEERDLLADLVKCVRFNVKSPLPIEAAMVTAGGVALKEIAPRTMASRLVRGLYFCGEVMDIDADTGGYNLQAAFSTGYIAGQNAAAFAALGD